MGGEKAERGRGREMKRVERGRDVEVGRWRGGDVGRWRGGEKNDAIICSSRDEDVSLFFQFFLVT